MVQDQQVEQEQLEKLVLLGILVLPVEQAPQVEQEQLGELVEQVALDLLGPLE